MPLCGAICLLRKRDMCHGHAICRLRRREDERSKTMEIKSTEAGIVRANLEIVQENMRLKRELEETKAELTKVKEQLALTKKWNDRLREEKNARIRDQIAEMPKNWIEACLSWMTPKWAVSVIVGTAVMSLLAIGIAWIMV